ncbi:MAG: helix-turn-helix transcriptional regulator [Fibrobacteria bacterium]|nr:helix-turn-helix transcriptional regulator [Fibrobacteria bacterium]
MNNKYNSCISPRITRSLEKFGQDVDIARKKRRLTIKSLCERAGISIPLYRRLVKGSPGTSIGACAMILFALGIDTPFASLLDSSADHTGLLLEESRLPKRVRNPIKNLGEL